MSNQTQCCPAQVFQPRSKEYIFLCTLVFFFLGLAIFFGSGILQRPAVSSPFFLELLVVLWLQFFSVSLYEWSERISIQSGSSTWVGLQFMCHSRDGAKLTLLNFEYLFFFFFYNFEYFFFLTGVIKIFVNESF